MEKSRADIAKKILTKRVLFSSELFEIEEELISVEHAMTYMQAEKAIKGDTKAYIALMDMAYLPHTKEVINSLKSSMPILMNWTDASITVPDNSKESKKISRMQKKKMEIQNEKE